jgi:SWI/SNF-related matrix-associated actin-dependent regulator of chromatin subfamily A3
MLNQFELDEKYFSSLLKEPDYVRQFAITFKNHYYALKSPAQTDFAIVDKRTTGIFQRLSDLAMIRFEALLDSNDAGKTGKQWKKKGETIGFVISVNIYGSRNIAQEVGKRLSKAGAFLQHPCHLDKGIEYDNPHFFKLPNRKTIAPPVCMVSQCRQASSEAQAPQVSRILDSLDHGAALQDINAGAMVRSKLLRYIICP